MDSTSIPEIKRILETFTTAFNGHIDELNLCLNVIDNRFCALEIAKQGNDGGHLDEMDLRLAKMEARMRVFEQERQPGGPMAFNLALATIRTNAAKDADTTDGAPLDINARAPVAPLCPDAFFIKQEPDDGNTVEIVRVPAVPRIIFIRMRSLYITCCFAM